MKLLEGEFHEDEPPPTPSCPEMLELPADEVLLEYFLKDRSVSVFVVGKGLLERFARHR